jgi:hypothetical protein
MISREFNCTNILEMYKMYHYIYVDKKFVSYVFGLVLAEIR